MLQGKVTLPLWNELSLDYIGLPGMVMNAVPVGLWISALGLFLGLKSKISDEQKCYKMFIFFNFI